MGVGVIHDEQNIRLAWQNTCPICLKTDTQVIKNRSGYGDPSREDEVLTEACCANRDPGKALVHLS